MRFTLFTLLLLGFIGCSKEPEQSATTTSDPYKVFEYVAAPGQHINKYDTITTHQMACSVAYNKLLSSSSFISLGSFGGYVVVGFSTPIENDGSYNIQIEGNSFSTSSEPAIVWVMSDTNNDKLPNDTWYELKGSEYNTPNETRNYSITYTRPTTPNSNTEWSDNQGNSGSVAWNSYNSQEYYYPLWIEEDSYTLSGTLLTVEITNNGSVAVTPLEWGYADNFSSIDRLCDSLGSDSKYNHFKISDAVTTSGESANLSSIDFVKVVSASNQSGGVLGELSSDIYAIKNYNIIKNN